MLKKILLIIIPLIAIFALGVFIGTKIKTKTNTGQQDSFRAGWDAAQKRLEESGVAPKLEGMEIKNISGTIQSIDGNKLSIKVANIMGALSNPELDNRIVEVGDYVKIYELNPKEPQQFQKETEEFLAKLKEANSDDQKSALQSPEAFNKKEIKLSDLKVGETVTITADEDVKNKKQFVAKEISVQANLIPETLQVAPVQNPAPEQLPAPASTTTAPAVKPQDLPAPSAPSTNSVPPINPPSLTK